MTHVLGIDTSTTATKALIMDEEGNVLAVGRSEYGFETPYPLWSEQSPHLWWDATVEAIGSALRTAGIDGTEIAAVGLTGQMHGLVLLDEAGEVLRPSILWNDQRTQAECDEIRERIGRRRLIEVTGNDALTGFTAPKILWVRNHEPDVYARAAHVLLPKDYVRYRLTGTLASDRAGGSGTILFDLESRDWSREILDGLDLPIELFPPTFEGPQVTGTVSEQAAGLSGLRAGTPVMAGGGDQAANGVGVGAIAPGVVAVSLGTSGVVFGAARSALVEPEGRLHAFCHAVPETWHLMGVMLSAAGSLRWFRDALAPRLAYEDLEDAVRQVPAGSAGLVFLPYLTGERTPHPDPLARGAFVGLTVRHGLGHMARAVMEGVAFGLRDSLELMADLMDLGEVRASGGGAASEAWLGILASVIGRPIRMVATTESAAHGAAILAAAGSGIFDSPAAGCEAAVRLGPLVEPADTAVAAYDEAYRVYRDLYPDLRSSFHRLATLES